MDNKEIEEKEGLLSAQQRAFRDQIAIWLNKYPWFLTWTVTFDVMEKRKQQNYTGRNGFVPGHGWTGGNHYKGRPEKVGITQRNARRYFEKHMRQHYPEWSWFYCTEPNKHRDGHHIHTLLIPPAGAEFSFAAMGKLWWDQYGYNKVEYIRSTQDVTGYCTKHVVRYLNKSAGWYNIEINDSEVFHRSILHSESSRPADSGNSILSA